MIRQSHSDFCRRKFRAWLLLPLLLLWADLAAAQITATNIASLRQAAGSGSGNVCTYTLEGLVLGVDTNSGTIFFQDDSGTEPLTLDLPGAKPEPGQKIRLCGTNYVTRVDACISLGGEPLVDTDNRHSPIERSGTISLKAGRHPVMVKWFNWRGPADLEIAYSGPHLAKQKIPDLALWRMDSASGSNAAHGLNFRCFDGEWEKLPDFNRLTPTKTGVASNFDVGVTSGAERTGVEFKGLLDIPEEGDYTFFLRSDDGGQLFFYSLPPNLTVIGSASLPAPQSISAGQPLPSTHPSVWAETEGTVTFLSRYRDGVELELATGENRMRVQLLNTPPELPWYLLHGRLRVRGICSSIHDTGGQKYAGSLIAIDWQSARVVEVAPQEWLSFKDTSIGQLGRMTPAPDGEMFHLQGRLRSGAGGLHFEDQTGVAAMELLTPSAAEPGSPIECLARCVREGTNIFLRGAVGRESSNGQPRRLLTTALQVQQLKPEEAVREFPVEIRGVVTSVARSFDSFVIQDFTRAVYVDVPEPSSTSGPRVGDYCQIKGTTRPGEFSPIVVLDAVTMLGQGRMPQPIIPTRDQLLGGSLDAQYVELQGMVTATQDSYVTLLTSEGMLYVDITPAPGESWEKFLNAVIRVRGCFFANWDRETHRVVLEHPVLRVAAATVSVDVPAPGDLFEAEKVPARDLMQFNVRSDTFRRVKTSAQIVHCSPDVDYLMDGPTGLRCRFTKPVSLAPGDEVEVVGLVELGGASPLLRQAGARKTGHSPLPKPRQITVDFLSNSYDSTLVQVDGTLVDLKRRGADQVLEMQVGLKNFAARLPSDQPLPDSWTAGSRLRLNGVFHTLDGNQPAPHDVNSFELLLNSPADVQVIARPPWLTLGRLLVIVALLLIGLALAFIWINLLRRQVERRTIQLHREISERERTEKWRAIEQERSRIARDLHDDLGSKLTEISMLATTISGLKIGPEVALDRLGEIAQTSRAMTAALEGVVWVINSRNDTLSSLLEYLASVAEEFLDKAGIACRVEFPASVPEQMITAEARHDVLLSVREALNNAVRHGHPTEVLLRLSVSDNGFEVRIQDNGSGFNLNGPRGHGLENLHQRMTKLKGTCVIESSPGSGTIVILKLPFPREPEKNGSHNGETTSAH